MAFKQDGKFQSSTANNTEKVSEKFTQGDKDDGSDEYKKHDETGTHEYRSQLLGGRFWFSVGFFAFTLWAIGYLLGPASSNHLDVERDRALRQQADVIEEQRQYLEAKKMQEQRSKLGPFSEA